MVGGRTAGTGRKNAGRCTGQLQTKKLQGEGACSQRRTDRSHADVRQTADEQETNVDHHSATKANSPVEPNERDLHMQSQMAQNEQAKDPRAIAWGSMTAWCEPPRKASGQSRSAELSSEL